MMVQGPEEYWDGFEDVNLLNYCCIEYSMMGVYWLGTVGYKKLWW